ncbi:MAG: hypothetical protein OXG35_04675, partial [Acidobacteria bacterium]|nr:hypothetical protein [Acidobacteriota bacterium]
MVSMTSPVDDVLPIVLDSELRAGPAAGLAPETIARPRPKPGSSARAYQPVCMAVKRETFAGRTR